MSADDRVIYSINVKDLQRVAHEELERGLTDEEIDKIEERLGDYIDWYGTIALVLKEVVKSD